MKYCPVCKLYVRGAPQKCPLCQSPFTENGDEEDCDCGTIFPVLPSVFEQYNFMIRMAIFLSISASVIAVAINLMVPHNKLWSFFVVLGIACVLCSFIIALRRRHNIMKNMYNQVLVVSIFAVIWDFATEWRGWSIDFVQPILFGFSIVLMFVIAQILKVKLEEYLFYILITSILGLIPLILLACGIVNIVYPSYICIILSVISLSALGVFYTNKLLSEIKKRFHM